MSNSSVPVPAAHSETRPWRQEFRGGTIDDRKFAEVTVSVPARIRVVDLHLPSEIAALSEAAIRAISRLDADHSRTLIPLSYLLLRSESIASSKIESEEAPIDDFVRALHGSKSNSSATAMAAATGALDLLTSGTISADSVSRAHRLLLEDDISEAHLAGRHRPMQNWIGGSDHSPRGALYVPPPPESVPELMDDLLAFAQRDDLPVIAQAAVAHSQFEAIHPFTDGNGRIGRALAAGILQSRGVTSGITIPIAAALVEVRGRYFAALNSYHAGDAEPVISLWSKSSMIAAEESQLTAHRLAFLPAEWAESLGHPRNNSAAARILSSLAADPVFTIEDLEDSLGLPSTSASRAVSALTEAGILRGLTSRKRNQIWGAGDVLAELEDLNLRIGARARSEL
ncbi:Fic family protein [Brevibacterium marinum]|uniref:Fic family protein n=1 Tax=Brevibacterium marinum TaxID=418643 RepID=A0A846S711_9MICO|nr:Fic family protein [Brevibacterium marinum]NJC57851.1 Fic family protein [Brevibacterium marinum]